MNMHQLMRELREPSSTKIVLLVADGLGGLPQETGGKTELETARTPNLDACVREGTCGLSIPILPGITPGSGPGHLGLFGYDPLEYRIGRGILEAPGTNFAVTPRDVAARGHFCPVGDGALITHRRPRPRAAWRGAASCSTSPCTASRCSSSRSASTASWWSSAATTWATASTTPTPSRPGTNRWRPGARTPPRKTPPGSPISSWPRR